MKKTFFLVLSAAAVLLTGCIVTSVYPFYTVKDVAFDPMLLGNWTNSESADEMWKFERDGTNAYALTVTSKTQTNVMQACRFKLGGEFFLDLFTSDEMKEIQPPPIPAHLLMRVAETNNALQMTPLDYDWLAQTLTNHPEALRHYVIPSQANSEDGRLVLTADTADLQRFVVKHLQTKEAWKNPAELKRSAAPSK